jgi:hypothetical protein
MIGKEPQYMHTSLCNSITSEEKGREGNEVYINVDDSNLNIQQNLSLEPYAREIKAVSRAKSNSHLTGNRGIPTRTKDSFAVMAASRPPMKILHQTPKNDTLARKKFTHLNSHAARSREFNT